MVRTSHVAVQFVLPAPLDPPTRTTASKPTVTNYGVGPAAILTMG